MHRRPNRGQSSIARGQSALHVAELPQEVARQRLGLDLQGLDLRGVSDVGGLARDGHAPRKMALVQVESGAAQEAQAYGARRSHAPDGAAKGLELPDAL